MQQTSTSKRYNNNIPTSIGNFYYSSNGKHILDDTNGISKKGVGDSKKGSGVEYTTIQPTARYQTQFYKPQQQKCSSDVSAFSASHHHHRHYREKTFKV